MKSIDEKRKDALARREKELAFWERQIPGEKFNAEDLTTKLKRAKADIANLKKKLEIYSKI